MLVKKIYLAFTSGMVCSALIIYVFSNMSISTRIQQELTDNYNACEKNLSGISTRIQQELTDKETSFLTPAEKRFKLYDGVETFVMFIGHPRSRHSLVAAILDAHPEIIISHEYSVLENWNEYRRLKQKNMQKYKLFFEIHNLSTEQSMFGLRGETNLSRYSYYIPGLWQGGYEKQIKVIGDKRAGHTSLLINRFHNMQILEEVHQAVQVPMKFIHVIRNPFDNIATMLLHSLKARDIVRKEGVKINNTKLLQKKIEYYFSIADANKRIREQYGNDVIDIPGHETVLRPKKTLQRLCDHLGVTCSEDYIEKCSQILFDTPSFTRHTVVWTKDQIQRVTKKIMEYSFLEGYSFDKYPS